MANGCILVTPCGALRAVPELSRRLTFARPRSRLTAVFDSAYDAAAFHRGLEPALASTFLMEDAMRLAE